MSESEAPDSRRWLPIARYLLQVTTFLFLVIVTVKLWDPLSQRLTMDLEEAEALGIRLNSVQAQLETTFLQAADSAVVGAASADEASAVAARWGDLDVALPSLQSRLERVGSALPGTRVLWLDEYHP